MTTVFDKAGHEGRLVNDTSFREAGAAATIALPNGREVRVPAAWLQQREGDFYMPVGFDEIAGQLHDSGAFTVPVVEETLHVGTRKRENVVRIRKTVSEHEELLQQPVLCEYAEIERVPINQPATAPVSARQEGDMLIIPLVEEEIVWQKRLIVREEIRIRLRQSEEQANERVRLRREDVVIERDKEPGANE